MPTYSYACKSCPAKFDIRQSFEDAALTECPECGGTLRKLFGRVGVVFKGSGFYRTDSRGGSSSVPAASPASETAKPAESSSTSGSGGTASSAAGTSSAPAKAPAASGAGSAAPSAPAKAG